MGVGVCAHGPGRTPVPPRANVAHHAIIIELPGATSRSAHAGGSSSPKDPAGTPAALHHHRVPARSHACGNARKLP